MKPFENYIQYLKRLQSNYEVGTGQHNVLGIAINKAEQALRQFDVIKSVCPKCGFEPMINIDGKYKCEMCSYDEGQTVL